MHPDDSAELPDRQGMAPRGVRWRLQGGGRRQGARAAAPVWRRTRAPRGGPPGRRRRQREEAVGGPRGRPRRDRVPARRTRPLAGMGGLRRRRRRTCGAYLRDLHDLYEKYDYDGALYGHFGDGCIHSRISFDLRTAIGDRATTGRSWRRPPTSSSPTAGRSRASTATASSGRSCCRSMYGDGARRGVPRVQAHLGPGLEDEPGQGRRRLPLRREPQARHRLQPVAPAGEVRLSRGRRRLRPRRAALRRRRQVPHARRRRT